MRAIAQHMCYIIPSDALLQGMRLFTDNDRVAEAAHCSIDENQQPRVAALDPRSGMQQTATRCAVVMASRKNNTSRKTKGNAVSRKISPSYYLLEACRDCTCSAMRLDCDCNMTMR
ncbi:hypothetical protein MRB53_038120 [Persea americana]|nr:hypothetical protein MRB53_038120 [Persea americana]